MLYQDKPIFGTMIPAMVTPFDKNGELVFGGAFDDHLVWGDGSEDDGEAEE